MTRPKPFDRTELIGAAGPWGLAEVNVWTGSGAVAGAVSFGADGRVLAVGGTDEVRSISRNARFFAGDGLWVCPGFVDPHIHVRAAASARTGADISQAWNADAVIAAVRDACHRRSRSEGWVSLSGLQDLESRRSRRPHRLEIDRVSAGARVRIRDRSGHGWLFNSAGLEALGVGAGQDLPAGVVVERGPDAAPTGFVADHVGWVGSRLGRLTASSALGEAVRDWSRDLARAGVVALCDVTATNDGDAAESLSAWRADRALLQDFTFLASPDEEPAALDRCAGVKFADAGDPRLPPALAAADELGHVGVHCVDPAETAAAIGAARAAGGRAGERLRIEHASFVPDEWVGEIAALGATVVTHPAFIAAHGDRYLGDPDLTPPEWLYRLRSWVDAGVPLAFGSDAPFGPADPLDALRGAADRRSATGEVIGAGESLHGEAALAALTTTAARCSGLDRFGYGTLRPGGPAAAVLLTEDPRDAGTLARTELVATIIGGDVAG